MNTMFENKIAIVTGGSEGIGFEIASNLASKGAHVYLVARTLEKLKKAKDKILQQGGKVDIRAADILNFSSIKELVEDIYKVNGRIDIFINNAGTWEQHNLDSSFADIWKLIEFDMKAPYEIAHYLAGRFRKEKNNNLQILTVSSQAAIKVLDSSLGYGTAKMGLGAGLFHIERELEKEGASNVSLFRLYPNAVATEKMMDAIQAGNVPNPVKVESVAGTAIDMLLGKTPTRDVRIGYYLGKGIIRTFYPSNSAEYFNSQKITEEIVDPNFTIQDLFK